MPAASTAAFEEALQKALPEQFGRQPDLLFQAVHASITPQLLRYPLAVCKQETSLASGCKARVSHRGNAAIEASLSITRVLLQATMLSPRILERSGIPVHQVVQEAGELVVTFPSAYHANLDLGIGLSTVVMPDARPPGSSRPAGCLRSELHGLDERTECSYLH